MKTSEALLKNFKLLFRSKETAFTIIFGPLLIILLVGFAFSGQDEITLNLGIYADEYTSLADDIINSLSEQYPVNIHATKEECLEQVKIGTTHLCILFPADFVVKENHTNNVEFNVDPSRINLVYAIVDELSTKFGLQREALSLELTNKILGRLSGTKLVLADQSHNLASVQENRKDAANALDETVGHTTPKEMNFSIIDLRILRGHSTGISQDAEQLYTKGDEDLQEAISVLNDMKSDCVGCSNSTIDKIELAIDRFEETRTDMDGIHEETPNKLQAIYSMIDSASNTINQLEDNYEEIQRDGRIIEEKISDAIDELADMKEVLNEAKGSMEYMHEVLDTIAISEAGTIVSPISTTINPVTTERSNLSFTYPYVLMLVIMFMGLMLGSTLIVSDKNSRAAFRNFTTATRDEFHIFMSFITTLLILVAQVAIILFFSYFLVATPLMNNFGASLIIILLAITLFSFFGMTLGYLSHNQESAMIASLTIGSVMLFISNLVIPIESMNFIIRIFTSINPYVLLSELLKKSMLFGTPIRQFGGQLIIVFALAVALLVVIMAVQQYVRKRYFAEQATVEVRRQEKPIKCLELGDKRAKDEYDLLTVLDLMTRQEFSALVNEKDNPVYDWLLHEVKNKKLAAKLKTASKERMMLALDKHLRKMTKKHSKK
ncbi:ABC transporter permease [Candidatus Woesearchaeota archaeon]|nr:ABC transporter permease [Candidatus Woesearchaeota archaeon]